MIIDFETLALRGKSLVVSDTLYHMFYVRSKGRTNWTHVDAHVEGNKVHLDCTKVKDPGGVRLNWWHISPFSNVYHMPMPGFELDVE